MVNSMFLDHGSLIHLMEILAMKPIQESMISSRIEGKLPGTGVQGGATGGGSGD